jgi:excisionase family DNA binding protein
MNSPTKMLSLNEAAEQLGLHYMTVYKYVRSGKLVGHKNGGSWEVSGADVDALSDIEPAPAGRGHRSLGKKSGLFLQALLAGDQPGSWSIVQGAFDVGASVEDVICEVVVPALRAVGDQWAHGRLEVYEEHRASSIVLSLLGRMQGLPQRRGRKRGSVLIACPPLETHGLPAAMCAELIRSRGFSPINLGADTPVDTIIKAALSTDELVAIVLSTVSSTSQEMLVDVVNAVHGSLPTTPVMIGGVWPDLPDNVLSINGFPSMLNQLELLGDSQ